MSPSTTHQQAQPDPSEQIISDHPLDSDSSSLITNIPQRNSISSLPVKSPLMSHSRSDSIASRRQSTQAGSRVQGQAQATFAVPEDADFTNWEFDPEFALHLDSLAHGQPIQPVQLVPFQGGNFQQDVYVPYSHTQPQPQLYGNQYGTSDTIDPVLYMSQPQFQYSQPTGLQGTPGLTALPDMTDDVFVPMPDAQTGSAYPQQGMQMTHTYDDPSVMQRSQPQPYYVSPDYTQSVQQYPVQQSAQRPRSYSVSGRGTPSHTRPQTTAPAREAYESDSDSDLVTKSALPGKESRAGSGLSSNSSLGKQPSTKVVKRTGQKPQKDKKKTWVRINTATRGETTRTGRINQEAEEDRGYLYQPLPVGTWSTPNDKYTYEYKHDAVSKLDELLDNEMSARKIMAYIMKFPSEHLKLWIQVTPSDAARRYASQEHSKCLFSECPTRQYNKHGNIQPGHYRVAFDEKYLTLRQHKSNPNKALDPYDCTGFVHLTCLERFCDFEAICRQTNVEVDEREEFPRESSIARWTMAKRPETALAKYFVKACRKDKLRESEHFKDYPVHVSSREAKDFDHTLTKALVEVNSANRTRSQKRQFVCRKLAPGQLIINGGDLEVAMLEERVKKLSSFKDYCKTNSIKPKDANLELFYVDFYGGIVNRRIAECMALRKELEDEDAAGTSRKKGKGKAAADPSTRTTKRKVVVLDDESDSEPEFYQTRAMPSYPRREDFDDLYQPGPDVESPHGTRSSPRKRQRVNYSVDAAQQQLLPPLPPLPNTPPPPVAPLQAPEPYADQGYEAAQIPRHESFSQFFVQNGSKYDIENWDAQSDVVPTSVRRDSLEYAELMKTLLRRKSSTLSHGPQHAGIMKRSQRKPSHGRQASFALQPVSESKEFAMNDPPSQMAATPTRRSVRLASRGS
ncbi:hypothetical protein HBH98_164940 [Parastagonospora nodorum]|nr:hypothetical protein HBH52_185190 [Parastagonospora nodorum]KAH4254227.1 hypothetical protein HBI03_185010 [Parastagonospora nodorum]KAH4266038.1 hypothetical protein HBI04_178890 [Parastagonospora nodorum]KAH4342457.1 hypothetical protein HBH98_164940 [Parastagonospora nodorum]KAH4368683.1 hypothetical protein HBH97_153600 [Parastagonospora nodorum]